jgi:hypothetical protein
MGLWGVEALLLLSGPTLGWDAALPDPFMIHQNSNGQDKMYHIKKKYPPIRDAVQRENYSKIWN